MSWRTTNLCIAVVLMTTSACDDDTAHAAQLRALRALASSDTAIPDDVLLEESEAVRPHGGHGQNASARVEMTAELEAQLDLARDAAAAFAREDRLSDAGYFLGVEYSNGVGAHYIDWRLVGTPFDPARPAMLLVDDTPGHPPRLAGFSYWIRGADAPEGFAGSADVWHHHLGLCFEDAVLMREWLGDPADCTGDWLDGRDLWMLHVWVVPGFDNPDGVFAPTHPDLLVY